MTATGEKRAALAPTSPEVRQRLLHLIGVARDAGVSFVVLYPAMVGATYDESRLDFTLLREAKQEAGRMKVVGNGFIDSPEKAKAMIDATGCDAVSIGRGYLGNIPWIFKRVEQYLGTGASVPLPHLT